MFIRAETAADVDQIRALNAAAFTGNTEADLVDRLRDSTECLSLVAVEGGHAAESEQAAEIDLIIGHILFSPVHIKGHDELRVAGLAPMAVLPAKQNRGVGTRLVEEGVRLCGENGVDAIVVLGHAHFYPKFGFVPAVRYDISSQYDVPDDVFMILELTPGVLHGVSGTACYHHAFNS